MPAAIFASSARSASTDSCPELSAVTTAQQGAGIHVDASPTITSAMRADSNVELTARTTSINASGLSMARRSLAWLERRRDEKSGAFGTCFTGVSEAAGARRRSFVRRRGVGTVLTRPAGAIGSGEADLRGETPQPI